MKNKPLRISVKLIICFVFAILDYYISKYAKIHFKPLFMDTFFEMLSAFAFGPVYGVICVLFKRVWNIIMIPDLTKWPGYLYSFCTIGAVLIACPYKKYFLDSEKDKLLYIVKLFLLSLIICLEMSIMGGLIGRLVSIINHTPYSMTVQTDTFMQFFATYIKSTLILEIISRIPVNVIDRMITVIIPVLISPLVKKPFEEEEN